jgi:hypothetical protein
MEYEGSRFTVDLLWHVSNFGYLDLILPVLYSCATYYSYSISQFLMSETLTQFPGKAADIQSNPD